MGKHTGHDRHVANRIEKAKAALGITVAGIHVGEKVTGEVRLSSNWVKVHLDELLVLAEGLVDCEARVVAAEEQRTTCAENLAIACESQRAAAARADRADETAALANRRAQELASRAEKAERELADACAQIATLNRLGA